MHVYPYLYTWLDGSIIIKVVLSKRVFINQTFVTKFISNKNIFYYKNNFFFIK